jgi:anti-sigma28 factor (negative regulator of flagellin synthesis)
MDKTMDEARAAKIANIKKAIAEDTYHVCASEVARRIIGQIDEP